MKNICGMCIYYHDYCTNNEFCIDGSGYRDKRETISAEVAIDKHDKIIHLTINGDMIKDTEKFGKDLFDKVNKFIRDYMLTIKE